MKKKGSSILLGLMFFIGLAILAYPKVSNVWNSFHSSRAIMSYTEKVSNMSDEEFAGYYAEARAYNQRILQRSNPYLVSEEERNEYDSLLDLEGNGIMGYIEIPDINVSLPVYHGTEEKVLQVAIGHLDWTSLPVGGESTHVVVSGHRGLPRAELFSRLDRLNVGDRFMLFILNEILTYEVDQVLIVLPEDVSPLQISRGEDLCTLVTCTPYGINTHRMLVRGHRVETELEHVVRVTADAIQIDPLLTSSVIAIPLLIGCFLLIITNDRREWESYLENDEENA